ncbi:helix-turn-helix domain-containing protein [Desulfitobacterium chlororespirans]|nr:transcriptional regulator [Desulfitobacterium chlororespirans]
MSVTELGERVGFTMSKVSIIKNGKDKALKMLTPGDILEYRKEVESDE